MSVYLLPSMGTALKDSYFDLKIWYHQPCRFSSSTFYGKLEIAGRYICVSAAHLSTACLSLTIGIVYDTAIAVLFFTLNTLTASQSELIYRNYVQMGFSATILTPAAAIGHALAAISPPFLYSYDGDIVERLCRSPSQGMIYEGFTESVSLALNIFIFVYPFV